MEFVATPVIFGFLLFICQLVARNRYKSDPISRKWFVRGFLVKAAGALLLGIIYALYYEGGDTYVYFQGAQAISSVLLEDPVSGLRLWGSLDLNSLEARQFLLQIRSRHDVFGVIYMNDERAFFVVQLLVPLCLLSIQTYFGLALYMAFFSHLGLWCLYRVVVRLYPMAQQNIVLFIYLTPSTIIWGSGILKDSITLGAMGIFLYALFYFFCSKFRKIFLVLIVVLCAYTVLNIKPYIAYSFIPSMFIFCYQSTIQSTIRRNSLAVLSPVLLPLVLISAFFILSLVSTDKNTLADFLLEAQGKQHDLEQSYYYTRTTGSTYHIPKYEPDLFGLLSVAPTALVATYLRPWMWEAKNPLMFMAALESAAVLGFILFVLWYVGLGRAFRIIYKDPYLIFAFISSLLFGIFVGISSGNFGNLVRYKIPALPFLITGLYILYHKGRNVSVSFRMKQRQLIEQRRLTTNDLTV
ncbi:MAG: hypothetical protein LW884_04225 [Bacteroidetes bacterium]|jgi:hypothetical protein|nr:hypothetical protein [Bacteroidota bacterium]